MTVAKVPRPHILECYNSYTNASYMKHMYEKFLDPTTYGLDRESQGFWADENRGSVTRRVGTIDSPEKYKDFYFKDWLSDTLREMEKKSFTDFNNWLDRTSDDAARALYREQVLWGIENIQHELERANEYLEYNQQIITSLKKIYDLFSNYPISFEDVIIRRGLITGNSRIKWNKSTGLFFIIFVELFEMGVIERMDGKKTQKALAELLHNVFAVKPTDKKKDEYEVGAFCQNFKSSSPRFKKHSDRLKYKKQFNELVTLIIKHIS